MSADWNQLFLDPTKVIRDPDPLAKQFIDNVNPSSRVFDFGCGAGRHLVHLARAGLKVVGGDVAVSGLKFAHRWLGEEILTADLILMEMTHLPFADQSMDGAISINVLQHGTVSATDRAVQEIERIRKPGCPFFFVVIGREDARCGEGDQIEPFTFVPHLGIEAGVPNHYYARHEI